MSSYCIQKYKDTYSVLKLFTINKSISYSKLFETKDKNEALKYLKKVKEK